VAAEAAGAVGSETEVERALRSIAPATIRTGCRRIHAADRAGLHDVERQHVRNAVPKRQNEFATGRALLRYLLDHDGPIVVAPSRAPSWPDGTRGSLAHDDELAVAAVTRDPRIVAIGIDIEPATPLSAAMAEVILRPEERGFDAHLAFTLKEAAYKAWSALGGRLLGHHEVLLSKRGKWFRAAVVDDGVHFGGAYATAGGRALALVIVAAEDPT
jgi:4'-phosphopantetheinyl transferase EntD